MNFITVLNEVPVDPLTGMKCVYLPDLNNSEVQTFIDDIYKGETAKGSCINYVVAVSPGVV